MAKYMGSDVTKGGLEWQFRSYKQGAKLQKHAVANGIDPKNVNVQVNVKGEPIAAGPRSCTDFSFYPQHILHNIFLAISHSVGTIVLTFR